MSFNNVYTREAPGKWGPAVGSATRAAVQKSRDHRAAVNKATAAGDGSATAAPAMSPRSSYAGASSSTGGGGGGGGGGGAMPKGFAKHDRAGLKGKRGWAKKGGGGHGKFTWGMPGDEMAEPSLSKSDPNYDSFDEADEENVIFSVLDHHRNMARKAGISLDGYHGGGHLFGAPAPRAGFAGAAPLSVDAAAALPPRVPLAEFKLKVVALTDEYLTSEDVDELRDGLADLHSPMLMYEFVRRAVTLAMERTARERELVSSVLAELHGSRALTSAQCAKGFERLFELIDDVSLDIPLARKFLSRFLARAVADEILPPSFLGDPLIEHIGADVVENAKLLLSIKHGVVRLEHVWGPTSRSSVSELKGETKMLLEEFLSSSDLDEACACVKRLNVPHFHHEVVKRAVVLSLDCREREQAMMSSLLAELSSREVVSEKQMEIGFRRLYQALPDLALDVPGAAKILAVFLHQAVQDRCLAASVAEDIGKGGSNGGIGNSNGVANGAGGGRPTRPAPPRTPTAVASS